MIKTNSLRYHPEFDLDAARSVYESSQQSPLLEGEMVTSPYDLYSVEELRDRLKLRVRPQVPTDVFVICKGEPPKPDCTKVGGVPYWPSNRNWPVDDAGLPLRFLAQVNFVDSKDLHKDLPGDVLLMFGEQGSDWLSKPIHFEWMSAQGRHTPIDDVTRLIFPKTAFHCAIYRSADYLKARPMADRSGVKQSYNLPLLNGTKIGGLPHFIQGDKDLDPLPAKKRKNPFNPKQTMIEPARPSRRGFLCQIASIQATPHVVYPWANQAEPLSLNFDDTEIHGETNSIVFYDMGSIFVYRDESGKLWSEVQSC